MKLFIRAVLWIFLMFIITGKESFSQDSVRSAAPGSFVFKAFNVFYKSIFSEQLSSTCGFTPSCSGFSNAAIHRYHFLKGLALTTDRLTRCNGDAGEHSPGCMHNPADATLFDFPEWHDYSLMKELKADLSDSLLRAGDTALLHQLIRSPEKSALMAGFLSALVPGAGKWYLGYPVQARSALVTNLALGGAATELLLVNGQDFLTSAGIALFASFYLGNVWGSVDLARQAEVKQYFQVKNQLLSRENQDSAFVLPFESSQEDLMLMIRKAAGNRQYNQVYILSQRIAASMDTLSPEVRRYRWMAMVEMEMFSECRDELMKYAAADSILSGRIQALPLQIRQKSPQQAQRLSARFPGFGQVYAGYPLQGVVSFLLHAGSLFLTWKAFESVLSFLPGRENL